MKIGEKFITKFSSEIYTAAGFFGATGVEYDTSKKAASANGLPDDSKVCIKIKETGGACHVDQVDTL